MSSLDQTKAKEKTGSMTLNSKKYENEPNTVYGELKLSEKLNKQLQVLVD